MTPTPDEARASVSAWAKIAAVLVAATACLVYAAYSGCSTGCSPGAPVSPATARATARAADLAAKDAVVLGYQACALGVGALDGAPKEELRARCHAALDPAAAGVELGAQLVDAWDDASAVAYGCAMADALGGLTRLEELLTKPPPALEDALTLLRALAPACSAPSPPDVVAAPVDAPAPPVPMPPLGSFELESGGADAFVTEAALVAVDAAGGS